MLVWNTKAIVDFCGGKQAIVAICARSDRLAVPPNPNTVAVWISRNAIPAPWLPALVEHCLGRGMSVNDLFREDRALTSLDDVGL